MNITAYFISSCAVSSISNLGNHKNAKEAMISFCSQELPMSSYSRVFPKLTSNYVFCAGPEVAVGKKGSSHHSKEWVRYGSEFAEFIVENDLGKIATPGPILNFKHHRETTCQVWVWQPDQEAMEKWWRGITSDPLYSQGGR